MLWTVSSTSVYYRYPPPAAVMMCVISSYSVRSHLYLRACYLQVLFVHAFVLLVSPYLQPLTDVNSQLHYIGGVTFTKGNTKNLLHCELLHKVQTQSISHEIERIERKNTINHGGDVRTSMAVTKRSTLG